MSNTVKKCQIRSKNVKIGPKLSKTVKKIVKNCQKLSKNVKAVNNGQQQSTTVKPIKDSHKTVKKKRSRTVNKGKKTNVKMDQNDQKPSKTVKTVKTVKNVQ